MNEHTAENPSNAQSGEHSLMTRTYEPSLEKPRLPGGGYMQMSAGTKQALFESASNSLRAGFQQVFKKCETGAWLYGGERWALLAEKFDLKGLYDRALHDVEVTARTASEKYQERYIEIVLVKFHRALYHHYKMTFTETDDSTRKIICFSLGLTYDEPLDFKVLFDRTVNSFWHFLI